MAEATKKPRKPKQLPLPTMEPPQVPALDAAALEYVQARDTRMRLLQEEIKLREKLMEMMKREKLPFYEFQDYRVDFMTRTVEKVKVKKAKDEAEEGEDDAEE